MGRKNNRAGNGGNNHGNGNNVSQGSYRKESSRDWGQDQYEELPFGKTGLEGLRITNAKYLNEAQRDAHETIQDNVITFLRGPAGTSKSFWAVYELCQALKSGMVKKAIISRPMVAAGEDIGHLPGNKYEKAKAYMTPILEHLEYFLGKEMTIKLIEEEIIEVELLQFMRGRNFNDCFVILDEAQNALKGQLKLILTRVGQNAKCIITMDESQIDLRYPERSCSNDTWRFEGKKDIGFFAFTEKDIVRSEICSTVIEAYKETRNNVRVSEDSPES